MNIKNSSIYINENTIIKNFLGLIASAFEAHSVTLFMPNSENTPANLIAYFSMTEKSIDKEAMIPQGKGLVGWILKNKQPLIFQIPQENNANLGYYLDETEDTIHSFLGAYVSGNGALCLDSKKYNFFSDNQQKLLDLYAKMIPQLFALLEKQNTNDFAGDYLCLLDKLSDLKKNYHGWSPYLRKLMQLLSTSLDFEYIAFTSLSDKKEHFYIDGEYPQVIEQKDFGFNGGLIGWVYKNEEPIYNDGKTNTNNLPLFSKNDGLPVFLSSVCIPIKVEKNIAAVLCMASESPKDFSNEFRMIMRVLSEDLAQFLEIVALRYKVHKVLTKK